MISPGILSHSWRWSLRTKTSEGHFFRAHYVAKSSVSVALGYSVNRTGSEEALNYLSESLDPNIGKTRGWTWTSPYHAAAADLNVQSRCCRCVAQGSNTRYDAGKISGAGEYCDYGGARGAPDGSGSWISRVLPANR